MKALSSFFKTYMYSIIGSDSQYCKHDRNFVRHQLYPLRKIIKSAKNLGGFFGSLHQSFN